MNEDYELDPIPDLPDELAELDRELAGLRMAERPSFAPELEAELEREWARRPGWATGRAMARTALAASIAAVVFAGLAVPPARASLVTRIQQLLDVFQDSEPAEEVVETASPPSDPAPVTISDASTDEGDEDREAAPPTSATAAPSEVPGEFPSFASVESTYPTLVDADSERALMRRFYPAELQRRGIGGTVPLRLWVDTDGAVDHVQSLSSSGVPALDRAAMQAATELRFNAATRNGTPVGTYVEFDMVFEPVPVEESLPEIPAVRDPSAGAAVEWEIPEDWAGASVVPAPIRMEARELLSSALGEDDDALEARFGSLDGLLAGDPPAGRSPLQWRATAAEALESAMARDPDNPAPYLALARIRLKQGLRGDAALLLERGVERAGRSPGSISPRLAAELAYEYGRLVKESWLGWRDLGRLPVSSLDGRACPRRAGPGPDVDTELLIAWNYLCPEALEGALEEGFEPIDGGAEARREMLANFERAVDAYPGHLGANVEILLHLAEQERWMDLLNGARRFGWATQGHPYALLLSGLALQRLGRAEEAAEDFDWALEALGEEEAARFRDVSQLAGTEDEADESTFWVALDPVLNTEVNERRTEHLARAAYAHLRFGGLDNDAARVWLRYGPPETVRTFGASERLRTELWDYGLGPDVTFTRPEGLEDRLFTPEASAYLDDLRAIVPHWYGNRARSLYSLPAQVARFHGQDGSVEIEAHLTVPDELKNGATDADSLELGIFLLGPAGERLSETRERIPVRSNVIRLRDDAGPAVVAVAVEIYDPLLHRAARVRLPARSASASDPAGHLSDLLLLEPAAPMDRAIGRRDSWVTPLTDPSVLDGDQVGLLFELYDLPETTDPYRIRVELEAEDGARSFPVQIRPSGQTLFGEEWARRPAGRDGKAVEYLTLDLRDVAPGRYTLRTVVTLPDGTEVVRSRDGMRRRLVEGGSTESDGSGLESRRLR